MSLPTLEFDGEPESFAPVELQSVCDRTEKPGTAAFRKFVLAHQGGKDLGILRECSVGRAVSEHKEGRAWDWGMSASSASDSARVEQLLDWLFAADAALFRRAGLQYIIWNKKIWSTTSRAWRDYSGPNAHTDHVHFSFSWPGANGETSLYKAIPKASSQVGPMSDAAEDEPFLGLLRGALFLSASALGWALASRFARKV